MNNKGFAITGILYTVFILFLMTLLAILSGLNTRLKLMQKSIVSFENDYAQTDNLIITNKNENLTFRQNALYTGKYVFQETTGNTICTSYIRKGKEFKGITFIENNENCTELNNSNKLILKAIYKFS